MPYRVKCPTCGKTLVLGEQAAGMPALCPACGGRLEAAVPLNAPPADAFADGPSPVAAAAPDAASRLSPSPAPVQSGSLAAGVSAPVAAAPRPSAARWVP